MPSFAPAVGGEGEAACASRVRVARPRAGRPSAKCLGREFRDIPGCKQVSNQQRPCPPAQSRVGYARGRHTRLPPASPAARRCPRRRRPRLPPPSPPPPSPPASATPALSAIVRRIFTSPARCRELDHRQAGLFGRDGVLRRARHRRHRNCAPAPGPCSPAPGARSLVSPMRADAPAIAWRRSC